MDEARSWGQMAALWTAMKAPVEEYDPAARSRSGLTGGAGARLEGRGRGCALLSAAGDRRRPQDGGVQRLHEAHRGRPHGGGQRRPARGAPPLQARDGLDDRRMVEALYVAAGFGQVIATRASISGAEGAVRRRWAPPPAWRPPPWFM